MIRRLWPVIAAALIVSGNVAQAEEKPVQAEIEISPDGLVEGSTLDRSDQWSNPPRFMKNCKMYWAAAQVDRKVSFKVKTAGLVFVAASWEYDVEYPANTNSKERMSLEDFQATKWVPINYLTSNYGKSFILFRRDVEAGESFTLFTCQKTAPIVVFISGENLSAAADSKRILSMERRTALSIPLASTGRMGSPNLALSQLSRVPPATADASTSKNPKAPTSDENKKPSYHPFAPVKPSGSETAGVALFRVRESRYRPRAQLFGHLIREIVVQAASLAARHELGLSTRDMNVDEWNSSLTEGANLHLQMVVSSHLGCEVEAALFSWTGEKPECLWDCDIALPREELYTGLMKKLEEYSRTELPLALERAGFKRRPLPPFQESSDISQAIQESMQSMTIPAQFSAVRSLHQEIIENGESPERLAALARSYAVLGVLSERFWSPVTKVFKARALLYAARDCARWPTSIVAIHSKAFAEALVGLHRAALEDITLAAKLDGSRDAKVTPKWVPVIDAFCRFQSEPLKTAVADPEVAELAALLQLLAAEYSTEDQTLAAAVQEMIKINPACTRAYGSYSFSWELGVHSMLAHQGRESTAKTLAMQVNQIQGLPSSISEPLKRWKEVAGKRTRDEFQQDTWPEMLARMKVIAALRAAGSEKEDHGEPSWALLSQLLLEINFEQAWRQLDLLIYSYAAPTKEVNELARQLRPEIEGHRWATFINVFEDDENKRLECVTELREKLSDDDVTRIELPAFERSALPNGRAVSYDGSRNDFITCELAEIIPRRQKPNLFHIAFLRDVSPYLPRAIALELQQGVDLDSDKCAKYEKDYAQNAQIQVGLARYYFSKADWDGAIRCYQSAIKLAPLRSYFTELAEVYEQLDDEPKFLSTLRDAQQIEDHGLGDAQINERIANHFLQKREWSTAAKYADRAAGSGAGWAILKAGQCHEGLLEWDKAEEFYRAASERYDTGDGVVEWFKFCCRTGHGDIEEAELFTMDALERRQRDGNENLRINALVFALQGRYRDAARAWEATMFPVTDPMIILYAAMMYDLHDDTAVADRAAHFKENQDAWLRSSGKEANCYRVLRNTPERTDFYSPDTPAALCLQMRKEFMEFLIDPDDKLDIEGLNELAKPLNRNDRANYLCIMAMFLEHHGQTEMAASMRRECMKSINFMSYGRTLAGAQLAAEGILPEDYREDYLSVPPKVKFQPK
jgi:tetratricopeptide (TPR) repeat protein